MADVIRGRFASRPPNEAAWATYIAQEADDPGEPEIKRPPDQDISDPDGNDLSEYPDAPGTPPFTGEDVEDAGEPKREHHGTRGWTCS